MANHKEKIFNVPTNIITGFLGVGKTSSILHLLKYKPANEHWAVLVNEFGEIGIDGSLIQGQYSEEQGVFIEEVPGGCMCCAAGLPMQVALTLLLDRARPDRLLIEPTGLGHPREVLQALTAEHYQKVLSIQKIITLVDARNLADVRYTQHDTFNQQIAMADIVVGNKQDLYAPEDQSRLLAYVKDNGFKEARVLFSQHSAIKPECLEGKTMISAHAHDHHHHHEDKAEATALNDMHIPEVGFIKAQNQGENYESIGWRFAPAKVFDYTKIFAFLNGLNVERMKAVFITEKGIFGYNLSADALTEIELENSLESRIEMIADKVSSAWEAELLNCLYSKH